MDMRKEISIILFSNDLLDLSYHIGLCFHLGVMVEFACIH